MRGTLHFSAETGGIGLIDRFMIKLAKKAAVLTVLVMLGVFVFFTPHRAFHNMRAAADQKDAATLSAYIDYPAVRESLKTGVQGKALGQVGTGETFNPLRALGAVVTATLADPVIDRIVTPENLSRLMRGEAPKTEGKEPDEPEGIVPVANRDYQMAYQDMNTFRVRPRQSSASRPDVEFVLRRVGPITWKLHEIHLP
jgi:hypothetical protein